jgi:hypothetical protein
MLKVRAAAIDGTFEHDHLAAERQARRPFRHAGRSLAALNRMLALGRPDYVRLAQRQTTTPDCAPPTDPRNIVIPMRSFLNTDVTL